MNPPVKIRQAVWLMTVSVVLLVGGAAFQPQETELTFETIEQKNDPSSTKQWEGKEPKLLVIASAQDIEEARQFVTDEAIAALCKMDFATQFAILAFRGLQGSSHAGFKLERILRRGNEVILYAQSGSIGGQPEEMSPYHLVKVKKEGKWDADFIFSLYSDQSGAAVASTTHHVP